MHCKHMYLLWLVSPQCCGRCLIMCHTVAPADPVNPKTDSHLQCSGEVGSTPRQCWSGKAVEVSPIVSVWLLSKWLVGGKVTPPRGETQNTEVSNPLPHCQVLLLERGEARSSLCPASSSTTLLSSAGQAM